MRLSPQGNDDPDVTRVRDAVVGARSELAGTAALVGPDGALQGPFACLPYSPDVGLALQSVGVRLRSSTVLDRTVAEAVILTVAAHWRADYEWYVHEAVVLAEHLLTADEIGRIADGGVPDGVGVAAAVRMARAVLAGSVSDEAYAAAVGALGERATVEVVLTVGYYAALAMLIGVFHPPIPVNRLYPWDSRPSGDRG